MRYEIRLAGRVGRNWSDWFGGFACTVLPETGETVLIGSVADQAALLGLLAAAIGQINLTLLSVRRLD